MRLASVAVIAAVLVCAGWSQTAAPCACGKNASGPPPTRSLKPYAAAPEDLRPFSKFTTPYYEFYQDLIEYNGAAREIPVPDLKELTEVRIGFLAPLYDHPDQVLGNRMLNGAKMAIDEANAAGGTLSGYQRPDSSPRSAKLSAALRKRCSTLTAHGWLRMTFPAPRAAKNKHAAHPPPRCRLHVVNDVSNAGISHERTCKNEVMLRTTD